GGHLKEPEWFDPYDVTRFTASVQYNGAVGSRPLAATLAWGQNREILGALDGYLFEWDLQAAGWSSIYGRVESMRKEILSLGVHPRGLPPNTHPHSISDVNALTIGHVWNLPLRMGSTLGLRADIPVLKPARAGTCRPGWAAASASAPTSRSSTRRPISKRISDRRARITSSYAGAPTD